MELNEAKRLTMELVSFGGQIERPPLEDDLGRVLAEDLTADRDLPGESRSRLDGFAVRSSDTVGASPGEPVVLEVMPGVSAAGHPSTPEQGITTGRCIRILTGAPVPQGADAVVAQEHVLLHEDVLTLDRNLKPGNGITARGDEIQKGQMILARGDILTPSRLALAAGVGLDRIPVYRQPRVALLATGDEVKDLGETREGPWTFCNNRYLLAWLVRIHGGVPIHLGVAHDNAEAIADMLKGAEADVVITTGGIGRGDRDFILEAWKILGIRALFRRINLTPGKNSAVGQAGSRVFCALPGNPWGAQVVFEEIIVPLLRQYQGLGPERTPSITAVLVGSLKKERGMVKAVRGSLNVQEAPPSFHPLAGKDGPLFAMHRNNFAYILLESHVVEVPVGSTIQVRLNDFPLLAAPVFGY